MATLIGRQINQYRVLERLGKGGMGTVYLAQDTALDRQVVIKVLHSHFAEEPTFQERFVQEARAVAQLDHPSIVKVHGFGRFGDTSYMVMEYVRGGSLSLYLGRLRDAGRVLPLGETLPLLAQVADALGYAHKRGIIHRDIKPDNILLKKLDRPDRPGDPPLRAVVTDFGLAKLISGGVQTETGTFMGSLPYMSPEQVLDKPIDGRSDLYSLGIVAYQLTTGKLPRSLTTPSEAVLAHLQEPEPPPALSTRPDLSPAVAAVVEQALASDPARRFQTGEALAQALRHAGGQLHGDETVILTEEPRPNTLFAQVSATTSRKQRPDIVQALPEAEPETNDLEWTRLDHEQVPDEPLTPPTPRNVPGTRIIADPSSGHGISLRLAPTSETVSPGATAYWRVTVFNHGRTAEQVRLKLSGAPAAWSAVTPATALVQPNATITATLTLQPPRGPQAPAGPNPLRVMAESSGGAPLAAATGTVDMRPFSDVSLVAPGEARHGKPLVVRVSNSGNLPGTVDVAGRDLLGAVTFAQAQKSVLLEPGEEATVTLTPMATARPFFGRTDYHRFEINASVAGQGVRRTKSAELQVPPRLTGLMLGLFFVALLIIGGGVAFALLGDGLAPFFNAGASTETPTPLVIVESTQAPTEPTAATGIVATEAPAEPTATEATPPSPTPTPPPTATPAPPTPIISADVTASQPTASVVIDGNLSEWSYVQGYRATHIVFSRNDWDRSDDLEAIWQLMWDNDNLYVAATIEDDTHIQPNTGNQIWRGDSIDMQLDTNRIGDFSDVLSSDDFQITLSPGDFAGLAPSAWRFQANDAGVIQNNLSNNIVVDARRTANGYILEAAIPWSDLALQPNNGLVLGIALNVNDTDGAASQEVMKSTAPSRTLTSPDSWGTLTLQ